MAERFHLDAPGWFRHDEALPHLPIVADAVWEGRRLEVTYRRGEGTVERRLDPLGLVQKAGTWYLVARHGEDLRTYRVARIDAAEIRDERFERPDGFDLASWWAESSAAFDRSMLRTSVRVRLSPGAARRLAEVTDQVAAREALATAEPPDHAGVTTVDLPVESVEVAAHQLLSLAPEVEAVAPPELRARLHTAGAELARRNG